MGWLNLIFGGLGLLQQILMLFLVYPKLSGLYQDFGADLPWLTRNFPIVTMAGIVFLAGVTYLGVKLAFDKAPQEKLFLAGLAGLAILFTIGGMYFGVTLVSVIGPIYSLTSNI